MKDLKMNYDLCVVGGAGHIGSIISILFASKGLKTLIYDINQKSMDCIASGKLPFIESGYEPYLNKALKDGNLFFTNKPNAVKDAKNVVIIVGSTVDEHYNPRVNDIIKCIDSLPLHNEQLLILRSTIYPGTTEYVDRYLKSKNINICLAFAPERLVQGDGFKEIQSLPQIISGTTKQAEDAATKLFSMIAPSIVLMGVKEAEFAKLFANCYRYIMFAAANQFYEMATIAGINYYDILEGAKKDYPRLKELPSAGMTAGSCLLKDTIQLAAYAEGKFSLGEAAIKVNEGLPSFIVNQLEKNHDLTTKTVSILGTSFKRGSDDIRSSISYKLKKILTFKCKSVLTTDPFVPLSVDPTLLPLDEVIKKSDILIIATNHEQYDNLHNLTNKEIINVWKS